MKERKDRLIQVYKNVKYYGTNLAAYIETELDKLGLSYNEIIKLRMNEE